MSEQISAKYKVPKKDFWKYLQLRNCIISTKTKLPLISRTAIEELFQGSQLVKGDASRFCSLMRRSNPPKLDGLKRAWEEDVGGGIARVKWEEIIGSWYKTSREIQIRLITYKVINRSYWTPCEMAREITEMTKIANHEQLIFKVNNKQDVFWKIWGPYMN